MDFQKYINNDACQDKGKQAECLSNFNSSKSIKSKHSSCKAASKPKNNQKGQSQPRIIKFVGNMEENINELISDLISGNNNGQQYISNNLKREFHNILLVFGSKIEKLRKERDYYKAALKQCLLNSSSPVSDTERQSAKQFKQSLKANQQELEAKDRKVQSQSEIRESNAFTPNFQKDCSMTTFCQKKTHNMTQEPPKSSRISHRSQQAAHFEPSHTSKFQKQAISELASQFEQKTQFQSLSATFDFRSPSTLKHPYKRKKILTEQNQKNQQFKAKLSNVQQTNNYYSALKRIQNQSPLLQRKQPNTNDFTKTPSAKRIDKSHKVINAQKTGFNKDISEYQFFSPVCQAFQKQKNSNFHQNPAQSSQSVDTTQFKGIQQRDKLMNDLFSNSSKVASLNYTQDNDTKIHTEQDTSILKQTENTLLNESNLLDSYTETHVQSEQINFSKRQQGNTQIFKDRDREYSDIDLQLESEDSVQNQSEQSSQNKVQQNLIELVFDLSYQDMQHQ